MLCHAPMRVGDNKHVQPRVEGRKFGIILCFSSNYFSFLPLQWLAWPHKQYTLTSCLISLPWMGSIGYCSPSMSRYLFIFFFLSGFLGLADIQHSLIFMFYSAEPEP